MGRILSGVQPTGNLHLGNYLGAIRNWVKLQDSHECLFMLADLHAITVPQDPAALRANVRETAAAYIACGVDPEKSAIFPQSMIAAHAELAWILSCHTPLGWLNRMTQFKEKAQQSKSGVERLIREAKKFVSELKKDQKTLKSNFDKFANHEESSINRSNAQSLLEFIQHQYLSNEYKETVDALMHSSFRITELGTDIIEEVIKEASSDLEHSSKASLGLFSYPVLMAADIILYKATHVPVGHDQKQHLELCRDVAGAFNRQYCPGYTVTGDVPGFFPLPEPVIMGEATRVMSLKDGNKKMSKSDESDLSRINLTDDVDAIEKKIKKATSDSFPTVGENIDTRPEASNLINIYAALKDITRAQALAECGEMNFSGFKKALIDVSVEKLSPITRTMRELLQSPDYIDKVLARGIERAQGIAGKTMREVKDLIGFLNV